MPRPLPIACTLSPADAAQRAGEWRRLAAAALVERERSPGRALLRFRDVDEVEPALRRLVEAERECCAFLDLRLGRDSDTLTLEISGPPQADPILDSFAGPP